MYNNNDFNQLLSQPEPVLGDVLGESQHYSISNTGVQQVDGAYLKSLTESTGRRNLMADEEKFVNSILTKAVEQANRGYYSLDITEACFKHFLMNDSILNDLEELFEKSDIRLIAVDNQKIIISWDQA